MKIVTPKVFIQTLAYVCSHIEDVHLLYCACFIIFFLFLTDVELRHFFLLKCLLKITL